MYYCIKEGLRIDTPVDGSLYYEALDAVTICGVPIGKGEVMAMNTLYPHYNPDYFEKPFEYIPERFDPQSEYFFKPGTKEPRDPKCYVPFGVGLRNCPGQTLAKLEIKVLLSRFITRIEYELDEEISKNPDMKFNLIQSGVLKGKITSKKG